MEEFKVNDWAVYNEPNRAITMFKIKEAKSLTLFNYDGDGFDKAYCSIATESQLKEANVKEPKSYDFVNPNHYKSFSVETIDMMIKIWGKEKVIDHCEMCAFKYKLRLGDKPDQPVERDIAKANWYINKAKELKTL